MIIFRARVAIAVAGLSVCVVSQTAVAQEPLPNPRPLHTIEEAEAEARQLPAATGVLMDHLSDADGTSARRCVEASGYTRIRSGDFEAGPFGRCRPTEKLWWVPLYPPNIPFGQF